MSHNTLGPLADLEQHLPSDWWLRIFNATYLRTDGDVVENAENTAAEVDLLVRATGLTHGASVLDLCCGQGRHCLQLARLGHTRVTGLDRSRYLVTLARKRARAEKLAVSFHEGDARRFKLREAPFDAIAMLGNSFGYFDRADDDRAVLDAVRAATRPGGVVLMDITDGAWMRAHFEARSWEWIDRHLLVCRERSLSADGTRLVCREVVVHAEQGIIADQFYAQRLYDRRQIADALTAAGFESLRDHADLLAHSARNQDLGMMAHRFVVTAQAGIRRVVTPRLHRTEVLVLLGDPRKYDPVRPNGTLTVDDGDALVRLRTALGELDDYTVRYHDDHATLLHAIQQPRPELVMNLCDEGYGNDLGAELHIPALLEILGLPYTGAGPACLGLCVDKSHVRSIAAGMGVPVPREVCLEPGASLDGVDVGYPAFVKPRAGDGSLGIDQRSLVRTPAELAARVADLWALRPGDALLVQEFLPGTEYTVGLLGFAEGLTVLPVLEVDYSALPSELPPILGYESKWNQPPSPYWTDVRYREAVLPGDVRQRVVGWSTALFKQLGCRDYARFDFRTDATGVLRLLEANPNPGWGWGDELNYMADWAGISYPQLLARILDSARRRTHSR